MKKVPLAFFLILISTALFAVDGGKITVMDFVTENSSLSEMQFVTDYLSVAASKNTGYSLLDRFDRGYILDDLSFPDPDCTDRLCQIEAAKKLPIDVFISGSLKRTGSYQIGMDLIDARTGKTIRSKSGTYPTLDNLLSECENLVAELLKKESPAAAASTTASAAAGQSTYKTRISGKNYKYTYKGTAYHWAYDEFPLLADRIVSEMPESMEAKLLQGEIHNALGMRSGLIIGGGLTTLGSMALWLPPLIEDEDSTLLWIGAGVGALGYVLMIIGLVDESDVPLMADLVNLYNRR